MTETKERPLEIHTPHVVITLKNWSITYRPAGGDSVALEIHGERVSERRKIEMSMTFTPRDSQAIIGEMTNAALGKAMEETNTNWTEAKDIDFTDDKNWAQSLPWGTGIKTSLFEAIIKELEASRKVMDDLGLRYCDTPERKVIIERDPVTARYGARFRES
jgi:hypothetical protein